MTIGVILLFGVVIFALFLLATRPGDPAPAHLKFGVPARTIRIFSLDMRELDRDRAISAILASDADIVLLQGVRTADVDILGQRIKMSRADAPSGNVFYPAQNFEGPATPFGNAIFSRFSLYEGRSIPNRGGSFGVWAAADVDDSKIMLASVQLTDSSSEVLGTQSASSVSSQELQTLVRAHEGLANPPIVIGGRMADLASADENALRRFGDAVAQGPERVLFSAGWASERVDVPAGICIKLTRR